MSTSKIDAWSTASLLDCADFVRGVTYTKSDAYTESNQNLVPLLRANNLQAGSFDLNDLVYVNKNIPSEQQILKQGDVVIATSSGSLSVVGKAVQFFENEKLTFGAFCGVLRPSKIVDLRYFGHFFKSQDYRAAVSNLARGVNINNLKKDHFAEIQIPIAPIEEQRRIADKLDTTLARVDTLNDRLARITPLLKRFRQSVLAAATSGRLTEDWRSQNDIAAEWLNEPAKELSNLVELDMGFAFKSAEFVDKGGIRLLRGDNIEPGNLRWTDAKKYPEDKFEEKRHVLLSCNDIVLAMDRPIISTGLKIAKVKKQDIPCLLVQRVCRVKCGEYLQNDYAYLFLNSQNFIDHLLSVQNGSSVPHISGKQILSYKVKIPSVKEQTEIVRRVETLLAFADRLEARLQSAQTAAERLTPALLAKAFRGELVPQDPNDEPAAELLRRLRAARAADTASKPKRGRAAKASTVSE